MRDPMLASSLYQTGEWIKSSGKVTTQVTSGYLKMQLDSHVNEISGLLSSICGENLRFEVVLRQLVHTPVEQNAPEQVKIICDTFKGQIVGHSKKTEQEIASELAQKKAEKAIAGNSGDDEEE